MSKRILIIDDCGDIREMVSMLLQNDGCEVRQSECRDEALTILGWLPDIVLLDYYMPGMTAEKFLHELLELSPVKLPRIVLMTAASDADDQARRLGIPEVLRKPFNPSRVLLEISPCMN